jgi:DNA-binding transcriptional MocR family regulator
MSNTLWSPRLEHPHQPIYIAVADALERDIAGGLLHDGARLPTHRELAAKLGVTPLTVTRAYREAARRGLIDSTVGRGTFVRAAAAPFELPRESNGVLDLSKNIVVGSEILDLEPRAVAAVRAMVRDAEYHPAEGLLRHRTAAAAYMARAGIETVPEHIVITPGSQQAILCILAALCRPGDTILAEEVTYPRFASIAAFLNVEVEPVSVDDQGLVPQSLEKALRRGPRKALYLTPNFQNPTGSVMTLERRKQIAAIARKHVLPLIEDDVYGFLLDSPLPPIATLVPEVTAYVTSMSKSLTPSLRIGFAALPEAMVEPVTSAFASTTAFTSSASAELFTQFFESGAIDRVIEAKRSLVATNRRAAERALGHVKAHAMSPHLWLPLPPSLDPRELADVARLRGIALAPGPSFAIGRTPAKQSAVRVSIGSTPDAKQLESGLRTVACLIKGPRLTTATVV